MALSNTHYGAKRLEDEMRKARSVFFIGIGGIHMSSMARILHARGYRVAGSDRVRNPLCASVEAAGIPVYYGHDASHIEGVDLVVYTVAISAENPEYLAAKEKGIPVVSRADFLGYLMSGYEKRVGVSGMHGKSTTTGMLSSTFLACGKDPTVICGAVMPSVGQAYRVGGEENFIFEACEYMDSFLDFLPNIAVILNVELEHVDYFPSIEAIRESFGKYAALTGKDGYCVANGDDENVRLSLVGYEGHTVTFGRGEENDYTAANAVCVGGVWQFDVLERGEGIGRVKLSVPGEHNIMNALATVACGRICGIDAAVLLPALTAFGGVARRMQKKGTLGGAAVYDDYAHHPTEIAATLRSARKTAEGRLFCVYQPHTYSRTAGLYDGFIEALGIADTVILADIYAAREQNTYGVSSEKLAADITAAGKAKGEYGKDFDTIAKRLTELLAPGDTLVVMGAGDIDKLFALLPLK